MLNKALEEKSTIIIPPAVYYEMWRGFKHKAAPRKEQAFVQMCKMYSIGEMGLSAWECVAEIYGASRKTGKPVEDTDILIAAFCIVNGYTLVTHNTKHFGNIDGLQIVDWAE